MDHTFSSGALQRTWAPGLPLSFCDSPAQDFFFLHQFLLINTTLPCSLCSSYLFRLISFTRMVSTQTSLEPQTNDTAHPQKQSNLRKTLLPNIELFRLPAVSASSTSFPFTRPCHLHLYCSPLRPLSLPACEDFLTGLLIVRFCAFDPLCAPDWIF